MGRALFVRCIGRDRAELQAVALEAHVALHPGVVQRGRILPTRQYVQVLGVVHDMEPLAELVAQTLDVAAGENPSSQIPVIELAVDDDLPWRRQYLHVQVLGFGGVREPAGTSGRDQQ